jgi:urea transport system permease protein
MTPAETVSLVDAPAPPDDAATAAFATATPASAWRARWSARRGSWGGRAAFVMFAVALFAWPRIAGTPTDARQWAEWLCYAMVAVGLDIAWGYGGMLALGQGLFFGLGAYAMGMHLSLEQVPNGSIPSFMALYSDNSSLPWIWRPFQSFWFAAAAAVVVPMVAGALLGMLVFRRRIRGPFFAILTQATAVIFALVLIGNLKLTAGFNGLTGFSKIFGRNKYSPGTNRWLYDLAAIALLVIVAVAMVVVRSRYGKLLQATRDGEDRVRFLGYDPALVKTVGFAIAAGMAGVAGAIAAPVFGIVSPGQFDYLPSILIVCWVAVGGRGTIWGAIVGALVVNWTRVTVSDARPDDWQYIQGLLFVLVLAFAPGGISGLLRGARDMLARRLRRRPATGPASAPAPASATGPTVDLGADVAMADR